MAFFDPGVYESLRKMILDSRKPDGAECLATLGLTFAVNLRPEEGGETFELIPDGGTVCVTPSNVLEYVKKYAMLRMVKVNSEPLSVSIFERGVEGTCSKESSLCNQSQNLGENSTHCLL